MTCFCLFKPPKISSLAKSNLREPTSKVKLITQTRKNASEKPPHSFEGLAGSPNAVGRFVRDIDNPLHNVSSNPKARKTLEMLASLMRSTKQKTIKDLENYLNQVYKKNHPDGDPTGYRNENMKITKDLSSN